MYILQKKKKYIHFHLYSNLLNISHQRKTTKQTNDFASKLGAPKYSEKIVAKIWIPFPVNITFTTLTFNGLQPYRIVSYTFTFSFDRRSATRQAR